MFDASRCGGACGETNRSLSATPARTTAPVTATAATPSPDTAPDGLRPREAAAIRWFSGPAAVRTGPAGGCLREAADSRCFSEEPARTTATAATPRPPQAPKAPAGPSSVHRPTRSTTGSQPTNRTRGHLATRAHDLPKFFASPPTPSPAGTRHHRRRGAPSPTASAAVRRASRPHATGRSSASDGTPAGRWSRSA